MNYQKDKDYFNEIRYVCKKKGCIQSYKKSVGDPSTRLWDHAEEEHEAILKENSLSRGKSKNRSNDGMLYNCITKFC